MIDLIQLAVAIGTIVMSVATFYLALSANRGLKESILVRKMAWTKRKVDYLHLLQQRIDGILNQVPEDTRITPKNSRMVLGTLDIERDKIDRAEIFFLLSESFLSNLEMKIQEYERHRNKTSKRKNDFDEMKRILQDLREIVAEELKLNKKEYKSITLNLSKL